MVIKKSWKIYGHVTLRKNTFFPVHFPLKKKNSRFISNTPELKPLGNSSFYPIDPLNQRVVQMICSTNLVLTPSLKENQLQYFQMTFYGVISIQQIKQWVLCWIGNVFIKLSISRVSPLSRGQIIYSRLQILKLSI